VSEDSPSSDPAAAAPRPVDHLKSYRVERGGEVVVMEYQAADGGQVELSMAAMMLPTTIRNLIAASQAAELIRRRTGRPEDVIQAIKVEGTPDVCRATDGAFLVVVRAQQAFPVSLALDQAQVEALVEGLAAAGRQTPGPPPRH
jgi:hypothetical protein